MIKKIQYDKIGIISSSLCMIHCMGTPFIFIAKACTTTCCSNAPTWWLMIDYLFLIISLFFILIVIFLLYGETKLIYS